MPFQEVVVLMVVAAAALYLMRRAFLVTRGRSGSGCTKCSCNNDKKDHGSKTS